MAISGALNALKSSKLISWKPCGRVQQTLKRRVEASGTTLHSGKSSTVRLLPELAGKGRYFYFNSKSIPASIDYAQESPLCTTLSNDGVKIRTVEHLLSALEAMSVDNCRIEITNLDSDDSDLDSEVPVLDGSARDWVERIEKDGLVAAKDECGNDCEKLAPYLNEPIHVSKNDSFVAAFPSPKVRVSYGIDFPQVAIGSQWFSLAPLEDSLYAKEIAPSRTFCIYEEVEHMRKAGLIKGGSLDNAIVCSASKGWLNPPLRFSDEPCRHKILDLVGDLSLFARFGNQGLPVAHIVVYKGGHTLHTNFVRHLNDLFKS
ncbi:PREDICTED: probable UDP-3-O-[3-hydroxymyristoyl] N-acetylglucosamine deacetylase 2 isoform X2 [Populus euphratica]|uniref:UDP-3-O-acyl-N-acetylglucosamine deacetylase n=1 Tax=Populus euphratica TaxID=75702 RepID=A0AAJ6U1U7_POPEU|nr:PREDICTED: probable UDP-3-O-[3-hydroxymyristoyl] N-acetylglucosamine deacetylase 2 isoform X2 [Populus euphratica]